MTTLVEIQARYAAIREKTYGKPKHVNISIKSQSEPRLPAPKPIRPVPVVVAVERQPDEFDFMRQQKEALRTEIAELTQLHEWAAVNFAAEAELLNAKIKELRLQVDTLEKKSVTMRYITQKIARYTGYTERELKSARRNRDLSLIRMACWYWIVRRTECSYPMVARYFQRDHTTVLHGVSVYPERRKKKRGRNLRKIKR